MDRLNQSEQCAVVVMNGNCILGCISKHIASWTEMIIPFYLAYRKPHLTHCAQFWAPHWRESITGPGIGGEGYEEKLRELYLFIWQMKNLQENLIVVFHYSKGVGDYKEDIVKDCLRSVQQKTRSNGHKLQKEKWDLHEGGGTQTNQKSPTNSWV